MHGDCGGLSDPVEHVGPALEGDALEHGEHGQAEVVEAGDAPLGALPLPPTLRPVGAGKDAAAGGGVLHNIT